MSREDALSVVDAVFDRLFIYAWGALIGAIIVGLLNGWFK